jgi:ribosomal protein RSM22 (predicted rRNA methylase)
MELPRQLQSALDAELRGLPPRRLERATAALVERYRGRQPAQDGAFVTSADDVAAYAAYRAPATFAALAAALVELRACWLGKAPRSLLDVGAGPGTALWAAQAVWPELERALLLERDAPMRELGQRLAARSDAPLIRDARWQMVDLLGAWRTDQHDLVTAGYVLNELPEESRAAVVEQLWSSAGAGLLLLEPGTPAGFAIVRAARQQLIAAGATVLAPCPHDRACPMPANDWCHFAARLQRTRLLRELKGGTLPWEDEKYAYVAVARQPGAAIVGRVLRRPQLLPGHVTLRLCAPEGLRAETITRGKDRVAFRQARDLAWGDALLPVDDDTDAL